MSGPSFTGPFLVLEVVGKRGEDGTQRAVVVSFGGGRRVVKVGKKIMDFPDVSKDAKIH